MFDLKSRGCHKLRRGSIMIGRPYLLLSTAVPGIQLLYDRMRFDDMCLILNLYVEINVI